MRQGSYTGETSTGELICCAKGHGLPPVFRKFFYTAAKTEFDDAENWKLM